MRLFRKYLAAILTVTTLLCGSWFLHKFYVSLTEIRYNAGSGRLEVSMRLFPDDLDQALEKNYGISPHLVTELEYPNADSLIKAYMEFHFELEVDNQALNLKYLGKEPEADAIWCYLESELLKEPGTIVVRNSMLTDKFKDQVNIIQVYVGKWNKGLLLSREHPSDQLSIGN